nr:hypothetical protein [uncultured Porphyromonas sp.]
MTDREMIDGLRLYIDDDKSSESGSKIEPQREEVKNEKAKLDTCIDWLIRLVAVISLLMTGFSAGCGDYLVAFCFATGLVNAVLLMTIRKEVRDESKGI